MGRIDEAYLLNHFQEAIEKGFIQSFFQPIYRSVSGKMIGAEALARWFDPEVGLLSPADFIPVLEKNGLIYQLDLEILRRTCAFYQELKQRGTPLAIFSVNLSRQDFKHDDLYEKVISILDQYEIPHEAIKLEITESLMIEESEVFQSAFLKFHNAGFSIWLDDFGSGYSSLNVLQNYDFDVIKYDMLFLKDNLSRGRQLLASLISMAKTLGIHTLTEGVETEDQREFLLSIGCEGQQGFYYSKPVSGEELITFIEKRSDIAETVEDKKYWDEIGRFNFMSPNPLQEYVEEKNDTTDSGIGYRNSDSSFALVECSQDRFEYVYASNGYKERIRELGFDSIKGLEKALDNQRKHMFLLFRKLVLDALEKKTVQMVEYAYKEVYFRLSVLLLSRKKDWAMMAMRLNTFDSEREVQTAQEMLNYSSALFSTYELVVLFYLDSNVVKRVYTANNMPVYDREKTIEESLRRFCQEQVEPVDQERYLKFLDFKTMTQRVESSQKKFIQNIFRMRWSKDTGNWYTARVTQIPTLSEKVHMLTIQNIQGNASQWLDMFAAEHPESFLKNSL